MPSSGVQTCADRKSTRLNSSHLVISYAVFCLKKKKKYTARPDSWRALARAALAHWSHAGGERAKAGNAGPRGGGILDGPGLPPFILFFNDTAPTEISTLSLHDALPISKTSRSSDCLRDPGASGLAVQRASDRSEEHTSELQSPCNLVCRLLLEKKN